MYSVSHTSIDKHDLRAAPVKICLSYVMISYLFMNHINICGSLIVIMNVLHTFKFLRPNCIQNDPRFHVKAF